MQNVMARVDGLIATVEANRAEHLEKHRQAHDEYRAQLLVLFRDWSEMAKDGKTPDFVRPPEPKSHVQDYDRILATLRLHTEETVELGEWDVQQYVLDNWDWKQDFTTTNSRYGVQ